MNFRQVIVLLKEFDYNRNGIELTIEFLEVMTDQLKKIKEVTKNDT